METISIEEMQSARKRTSNLLNVTPIMTSQQIDKIIGANVFFKCDHLQKTGSFKSRGALNSVILAKETGAEGVIAHSSGNHGQALAWAALQIGIKCTLVVPSNAPPSKMAAMKEYNANIVICEPTVRSREETCKKLAKELGYFSVDPSNCCTMINGHASLAFEILEQVGDKVDSIFLSVGGGGLAASIAYCIGQTRPDIEVYLVEPEEKQLSELLENGIPCPTDTLNTVADGVRVAHVGSLCKPILEQYCKKKVISVTEAEIRSALALVWTRLKQRIEPTAALAFAAVAYHKPEKAKNCLVVLCGGNVDVNFVP